VPWHGARLKSLGHGSEQKHTFHHRERCSNALPGTGSEREIREPWQVPRGFRAPPAGIELFRIRKEPGIAVLNPLAHHNIRTRRNAIAVKFEFLRHCAAKTPRWRVQPHRLFDDSFGIW
jgi:hypothetical protein